jgi:hypothetical protein
MRWLVRGFARQSFNTFAGSAKVLSRDFSCEADRPTPPSDGSGHLSLRVARCWRTQRFAQIVSAFIATAITVAFVGFGEVAEVARVLNSGAQTGSPSGKLRPKAVVLQSANSSSNLPSCFQVLIEGTRGQARWDD